MGALFTGSFGEAFAWGLFPVGDGGSGGTSTAGDFGPGGSTSDVRMAIGGFGGTTRSLRKRSRES
jgi:hypothetical protein